MSVTQKEKNIRSVVRPITWTDHQVARRRGLVWGSAAGFGLILFYGLIVLIANSFDHAINEFVRRWYWMTPIVIGFSLQIGLFAYGKRLAASYAGPSSKWIAASGGASSVSMVACCAHHLTDILALIGLAGATLFLSTYQHLFLLLGVLSNFVGLVYVLSVLSKGSLFPPNKGLLRWFRGAANQIALCYAIGASVAVFTVEVLLEFA